MKYFALLFFIFVASCNQSKKEVKSTKEKVIEKKIDTKDKEADTEVREEKQIKTKETLLLTLKNPNKVIDAKSLIENSGLTWKKLVIDKNTIKVAQIEVPIDKKEFWIQKLQTAEVFSAIEFKSEASLSKMKNLAENTFVKIRKTQCSGDCPVYEIILLKNRTVMYNGIENVLVKGIQEFTITEKQFNKIKEKFNKTNFGAYFDSYVDKSLMDYPSTFITHNDKQIEIKLWKNVPKELAFAYEVIEDILLEKKLIE